MSWSLLDAPVCPGWKGKEAEGVCAEVGLVSYCHSQSGDTPGEALANPQRGCRAGDTLRA